MIAVKVTVSACEDEIWWTYSHLILSRKELYTDYVENSEHYRINLAIMENNEEQDLSLEQKMPQRGRHGNNGRNQAPMPFIHLDDPFMLLEEFDLPPTFFQTAIRRPPIQVNNFELKSVTLQML